jgi:excisionase family DNA binding protein
MDNNNLAQPMTVLELAKFLRIGRNAAYALANSGEIRIIRVGKTIRIPYSAVQEYLDKQAS